MLTISAVLSTAGSRPLFAQSEEAEAMIRKGLDLRHQGQDAQAVPYLEQAYKLSRTPRTAAQLGLVRMALGYWVDAERYLDEALADPDSPWISKNRATLESARTRVRGLVGDLTITGGPAGAEVFVNGRAIGKLPLAAPVHLGQGAVEVELRAPDYVPSAKSVKLTGGARETISLVLQRDTTPATASGDKATIPSNRTGTDASAKAATDDRGETATPSAPSARGDGVVAAPTPGGRATLRPYAWAAGAAAAAGLALGIVGTVVANSKHDEFESHTSQSQAGSTIKVLDCTTSNLTPTCKSISDSYDNAKTIAVVGYIVGGALAATSAVLFVLSSPSGDHDPGAATAFGCAPMLTATGLTCNVRF